jgi:hypothetical protein
LKVLTKILSLSDQVDAGSPSYEYCNPYINNFMYFCGMYNSTIYDHHDKALLAIENYKAANSSQLPVNFRAGISSIGDKARASIIEATNDLFDNLATVIPGYSRDLIADYAFGGGVPTYPLRCIENLGDVKRLFVNVEQNLDNAVDAAMV